MAANRGAGRPAGERSGPAPLPPPLTWGLWLALLFLASIGVAALWPVTGPAWLRDYFTPTQLRRAVALGRDADLGFAAAAAVHLLVLAWLARRALARPAGSAFRLRTVVAWTAAALVLVDLAQLPLDFLSGYPLAHAYGLVTATPLQWLGDWLKAAGVAAVLTLPAVAGVYLLIRARPRRWWLVAATALALLVAAGTLLGPVLVEPLFFRFAPLPAGPLRSGIEALARRAGVPLSQIYVMDASSRTAAFNAYVSGLGGTARMVLYDTLLRHAATSQVLLVVAHEFGHWKSDDLLIGTLLGALGVFAATGGLAWLLNGWVRRRRLDRPHDARGVPALLLAVALLSILTLPLRQAVSRAMERRADAFAVKLTGDPQGYARLQARLAAAGLIDPDPPAWIEWTLASHPSPLERIQAALSGR